MTFISCTARVRTTGSCCCRNTLLMLVLAVSVLTATNAQDAFFSRPNGCDGNGVPAGGLGDMPNAVFVPFDQSDILFVIAGPSLALGDPLVNGSKIQLQTQQGYRFSLQGRSAPFDTGLIRVAARKAYNDDTFTYVPYVEYNYGDYTINAVACDNVANVWGTVGPGVRSSTDGLFRAISATGSGVILVEITVLIGNQTIRADAPAPVLTYTYAQFEIRLSSNQTSIDPSPLTNVDFFAGDNGCDDFGRPAGRLSELSNAMFVPFDESGVALTVRETFADPNATILVETNDMVSIDLQTIYNNLTRMAKFNKDSVVTAVIRVAPVTPNNASTAANYTFRERSQRECHYMSDNAEPLQSCQAPVSGITEVKNKHSVFLWRRGLKEISGIFIAHSARAEFMVDATVILTYNTTQSINTTNARTQPLITYTYNQFRLRSVSPGQLAPPPTPPLTVTAPYSTYSTACHVCGRADWAITLPKKPIHSFHFDFGVMSCGIAAAYVASLDPNATTFHPNIESADPNEFPVNWDPGYYSDSCDGMVEQVTKRCGCQPMPLALVNDTSTAASNSSSIAAIGNTTNENPSNSSGGVGNATAVVSPTNDTSTDTVADRNATAVENKSPSMSNGNAKWSQWWWQCGQMGLAILSFSAFEL